MDFTTLKKSHNRKTFDCGHPAVNDYLATKARRHQELNVGLTQVMLHPDSPNHVIAFYTLAIKQVACEVLPGSLPNYPHNEVPVILLGWMGIDQRIQGRGNGMKTLLYALTHALNIMESADGIGVGVIIDAIDGNAMEWYQNMDTFEVIDNEARRLFVSLKSLREYRKQGLI